MSKKVRHATSGDTIYHRVTQFIIGLHNFIIGLHNLSSGYTIYHRVTQFIIGLHNFIIGLHNLSSGYATLVPGYKFRGCQFEIPGYTPWSVIF